MSGRPHPRFSGGFATAALSSAAVAAVLRSLQFTAGLLFAYALTYGVSPDILALMQCGVALVIVSIISALVAKAPFAGTWAAILGASSLFALGLPRVFWPDCPHAVNCVDPGTQAAAAVAGLVWVCCIGWAASRARRRMQQNTSDASRRQPEAR